MGRLIADFAGEVFRYQPDAVRSGDAPPTLAGRHPLVEGNQRISVAIKYHPSTWYAALCVAIRSAGRR
jgi:hypothetical protein